MVRLSKHRTLSPHATVCACQLTWIAMNFVGGPDVQDEMNSLAFKQGTVAALGLFATAADAMTERHAELAPQLKSPVLGRISVAYGETQLKLVRVLR